MKVYTPIAHRSDPSGILVPALPIKTPAFLKGRASSNAYILQKLKAASEARGLNNVRPGDICYFWPDTRTETIRAAKSIGAVILTEFVNTPVSYAKKILDAEHDRIGHARSANYPDHKLQCDRERLELADLVFAPSLGVEQSIRSEADFQGKILPVSYGTKIPESFSSSKQGEFQFLFVGYDGLRKGLHNLLEGWHIAKLPARLVVVGGMDPWLRIRMSHLIDSSVMVVDHSSSMDSIYSAASVFVLPSFEEGDPLVTYEAAARGLPLLVSSMGGGRMAVHDRNAIFVTAGDVTGIARSLERLFQDEGLRTRLGAQARQDVYNFSWSKVAEHRIRVLSDALDVS